MQATPSSQESGEDDIVVLQTPGEVKADQVLRLYAASTQHLAGVKIVTRDKAEAMDVAELRKLRDTLNDLKAARNQRLVVRLLARLLHLLASATANATTRRDLPGWCP